MKKLGWAVSWLLGGFFLLNGIYILYNSELIDKDHLSSIPSFLAALLLLPPVRRFVHSKTNYKFPLYARVIAIVIIFIVAVKISDRNHVEYFNNNSASILAEINDLIKTGYYEVALLRTKKYVTSGNKELLHFHSIAKTKTDELNAIRKKNESSEKRDENYSWASKISKEKCNEIAMIGLNKGRRDRAVAIRDNNNMDFAYSFCGECSIAEKGEIATCYEIGYDKGYYGR
ncbi:MAG: hypothetical protein HZB33_01840 [Nitrospirae bacterium]|nr:hypothetical protein [Nitrospirota bacterium]